ncbi:GNAT family N-acetyltransferase [Vibrio sonorensis]|uniref:GNAT family N-acetyltransferase n=1 Tax=Vibrio sonorensis TaxID=1004316 RepID=UPI0008D94A03|nr:GNAT family N-acetyltransferase [Vibrio sonorensis]
MKIIEANVTDISDMNEVIVAAKKHWGYSQDQLALWLPDLLVNENTLKERQFWLLVDNSAIIGVSSVSQQTEEEYELEDCWVLPSQIGTGAGKHLFAHVVNWLQNRNAKNLTIVSDPSARGFYEHMGAELIRMKPSVPKGRVIPVLNLAL